MAPALELRGVSRASLVAAQQQLNAQLDGGTDPERWQQLADDLFAAVRLLDGQVRLRRTLSDPAQDGDRKVDLLRGLVGEQLSEPALELLSGLVAARWAHPRDLVDVVEAMAVQAEVAVAEAAGTLDDVEDELFRFGRIVSAQPGLRAGLADAAVPVERRAELVGSLLQGRSTPTTQRLVTRLVTDPRRRSIDRGLELYAALAAVRRLRIFALVRVAVPMTDEQESRLAAVLSSIYGREVHLNIEIDPDVIGGISVHVGDEVIDATMSGRLDEARRRMAG
jgi:F-type H+-transporting ATPase subunit delta